MHLVTPSCPFVNLPETRRSRFGEELSAEKMKKAVWLRPEAVAQIEFLEWTDGDWLRHSRFFGLREDKEARDGLGIHEYPRAPEGLSFRACIPQPGLHPLDNQ
jgi:hypothetical protein